MTFNGKAKQNIGGMEREREKGSLSQTQATSYSYNSIQTTNCTVSKYKRTSKKEEPKELSRRH